MSRIVVLGAGESGAGAAVLAKVKGFDTFVSDMSAIKDKYKEQLNKYGIDWEEGHHTEELILNADEVIKSPGIPNDAPLILKLKEQGTPIISEIEFAGRYTNARMICITGSNGKTTTTSLIYHIFKSAGLNVGLAGNIGNSLALQVATEQHDYYVIELSSFQLDNMYKFRANIAVLMNITPDHLDRYDHCFQNYVDSKMRITQNQTSRDWFVYSADDATVRAELEKHPLRARELPFMAKSAAASGDGDAYLEPDGTFTAEAAGRKVEIDTAKMQIKGLHNAYDAMAAALATLAAGVEPESIRRSIYDFSPVEHRLEPAGEAGGVLYINDSKATNVDSVWYALESMTRPVVWIAGGTDKGNDYAPLKDFARAKVHTLVCMGLDNAKLLREFEGVIPQIISTASLDEAMRAAVAAAHEGDAVLLSPACASFDLFRNYENRGELFKAWVREHLPVNVK